MEAAHTFLALPSLPAEPATNTGHVQGFVLGWGPRVLKETTPARVTGKDALGEGWWILRSFLI